jgi:hypothetical protein
MSKFKFLRGDNFNICTDLSHSSVEVSEEPTRQISDTKSYLLDYYQQMKELDEKIYQKQIKTRDKITKSSHFISETLKVTTILGSLCFFIFYVYLKIYK